MFFVLSVKLKIEFHQRVALDHGLILVRTELSVDCCIEVQPFSCRFVFTEVIDVGSGRLHELGGSFGRV